MVPHVLDRVTDDRGQVVSTFEPSVLSEAGVAVDRGDDARRDGRRGRAGQRRQRARSTGSIVGGKTGTAQLGTAPPSSHAWFVAFAGPPGAPPSVAVAVIVEAQPGISEVTGGRVAAPIARAVMEAALGA